MDIKIGTRTFIENSGDLNPKMVYLEDARSFDPNYSEFNEDELKYGINFDTYRKFVNNFTSSALLGFRIEGISIYKNECCEKIDGDYLKANTRNESEIIQILQFYFQGRRNSLLSAVDQLLVLKAGLKKSEWFYRHEIVCSSILMISEEDSLIVKMIDFGKTEHHPDRVIKHDIPWKSGNKEDGYLIGLENLIKTLRTVQQTINTS